MLFQGTNTATDIHDSSLLVVTFSLPTSSVLITNKRRVLVQCLVQPSNDDPRHFLKSTALTMISRNSLEHMQSGIVAQGDLDHLCLARIERFIFSIGNPNRDLNAVDDVLDGVLL